MRAETWSSYVCLVKYILRGKVVIGYTLLFFIKYWKHNGDSSPENSKRLFIITLSELLTPLLIYLLTYLLHGAESFLRSKLVCSYSKNSPHFMEPEGSLPHSQASATCPYPGPAQSSPYTHIAPRWRSILILSTLLRLGLPSGLFPSGFPTKTLYAPLSSPIRTTFPAHLILLDFITRPILGEEYRSFSSSLCSLLHSPVISSLLP